MWRAAKFLLAILFCQIILGGLTVLMLLNPFIVTAHLAFGTIFFQTLALVALERFRPRGQVPTVVAPSPGLRKLAAAFPLLVFGQMLLGGFVGASGASFACPDIPLCHGKVLPDLHSGQEIIHMTHRFLAVVLLILVGALFYLGRRERRATGHLFGLVFMVALQITLGLSSVYFGVPVSLAVAHLLLGQLILLAALTFRRALMADSHFFSPILLARGVAKGAERLKIKDLAPAL